MLKLYIALRGDLTPGLKIPQACHAQDAFYEEHPEFYAEWRTRYKNLIVKETVDEVSLRALLVKLKGAGVAVAQYYEEDLDNTLTAIAFYGPTAKRYQNALPLALQLPKAA